MKARLNRLLRRIPVLGSKKAHINKNEVLISLSNNLISGTKAIHKGRKSTLQESNKKPIYRKKGPFSEKCMKAVYEARDKYTYPLIFAEYFAYGDVDDDLNSDLLRCTKHNRWLAKHTLKPLSEIKVITWEFIEPGTREWINFKDSKTTVGNTDIKFGDYDKVLVYLVNVPILLLMESKYIAETGEDYTTHKVILDFRKYVKNIYTDRIGDLNSVNEYNFKIQQTDFKKDVVFTVKNYKYYHKISNASMLYRNERVFTKQLNAYTLDNFITGNHTSFFNKIKRVYRN